MQFSWSAARLLFDYEDFFSRGFHYKRSPLNLILVSAANNAHRKIQKIIKMLRLPDYFWKDKIPPLCISLTIIRFQGFHYFAIQFASEFQIWNNVEWFSFHYKTYLPFFFLLEGETWKSWEKKVGKDKNHKSIMYWQLFFAFFSFYLNYKVDKRIFYVPWPRWF